MPKITKEWLDKNLSKFVSRKLFVFVASSVLLCVDKIAAEHWVPIAVAYVGAEGFADVFIRIKQARSKDDVNP